MSKAKFILSKKKLLDQVHLLENLGLKISYSYKTNKEVGDVLQSISDVDFSVHSKEEINRIQDKSKIWFFVQAEDKKELEEIFKEGVRNFVVDNELDLKNILKFIENKKIKINLSLRMKFQEHRIGTGKYFVYGMSSKKINEIISRIKNLDYVGKIGVHIHRKSQNTSEWEIKKELIDSLTDESLKNINFLNLGGGLPANYRSYTGKNLNYIFKKLKEVKKFLYEKNIKTYIEPGRFLAGPCIKLETKIIQIQGKNIIINTTIYNCALDTLLTGTKLLVDSEIEESQVSSASNTVSRTKGELEAPQGCTLKIKDFTKGKGEYYLIKGNSPTRDDIFRYKVKLKSPKVGDKIVFLNAGAYNYSTDFFGYKKLETEIL